MPTTKQNKLINDIDALLPQTQCEDCEYPGCKPYASAIVLEQAPIDKCLPGGVRVLKNLGGLLKRDVNTLIPAMKEKVKPNQTVVIREAECIGCLKCINACPVDAIIGTAKHMHSVITDACTGCELCIPPCPMDCIDIIPLPPQTEEQQQQAADTARQRFEAKQTREQKSQLTKQQEHQKSLLNQENSQETLQARQQAIAAAVARVRAKKQH